MRGLVSSLGVFAGGAGLAALTRGAYEAGRSLSTLGSTLVEQSGRLALTAEQIQLLGRTFEGGGASQETFLKGFRNFNRTLIDAQSGLETYRRVFRNLGIDVDALAENNVSAYDSFLLFADGLRQTESQAVRINAAQTLLGRGGADLLFELQKGSEALRDQSEAFRSLGIITDEQAARLKALEQSYVNTGNAIRTAQAQIVADNRELFQAFNEFLARAIPQAFEALLDAINAIRENLGLVTRGLGIFFGLLIARGAIGRFVVNMAAAVRSFGLFSAAAAGAARAFRVFARALGVGLLIEGLLVAVDAVAAIEAQSRRTGRNMIAIFGDVALSISASLASGLTEAITRFTTALLELPALITGLIIDGVAQDGEDRARAFVQRLQDLPIEAALAVRQSIEGVDRAAAQSGGEVVEDILDRIRARYTNFLGGVELPALPAPVDVPFRSGEQSFQREAEELRRQVVELAREERDINMDIAAQVQERVLQANRELGYLRDGILETDQRRIVEEGWPPPVPSKRASLRPWTARASASRARPRCSVRRNGRGCSTSPGSSASR